MKSTTQKNDNQHYCYFLCGVSYTDFIKAVFMNDTNLVIWEAIKDIFRKGFWIFLALISCGAIKKRRAE